MNGPQEVLKQRQTGWQSDMGGYTENCVKRNVGPGSVNIVRTDNLRAFERVKNSATSRRSKEH